MRRRLLIVEDNPADVLFLQHALRENGLVADIAVAPDGDKAIEYLDNCAVERRPDLVIIDINLPRRDGIDVLRKCRFTPSLLETRTLVLTSSDEGSDHNRAEMIGVNAYLRKPRNVGDFVEVVATIRKLLESLEV